MPTPVFCCGFECGQLGAVGQHFSTGTNISISTATVRTGARSLQSNQATSAGTSTGTGGTSGTTKVWRVYIMFTTLPNADCIIAWFDYGGSSAGIGYKNSDTKLYSAVEIATVNTFGSTGVTVTTGVWYSVNVRTVGSVVTGTSDIQVDEVACGQATGAFASANATNINFGSNAVNITGNIFYDDFILSETSADYPIGAGKVEHFVAISDGTHTSTGTTTAKGTIATPVGAAITSATTDAFNWVNGVPLLGGATDNTRLINAVTAASTTYAEVVFGPAPGISTPTVAPRAVEVITADRQATTAVGDFTTKLNDNGTENTIIARGAVAGVVTDRYARKHYALAPTSGAWTVVSGAGNFNNIRARFGYAADANPDQYWRGIMIEAEFAEIVIAYNRTRFFVILGDDKIVNYSLDSNAQTFISASGITDQNQQSAINNLVLNAKANGWWSKCNAIYPMVGGSSGSMKWNLKNPVDTDAAFRLSFLGGGWIFSNTGAKPNGTTSYADTFLVPSTILVLNDSHISYYSRDNTAFFISYDIGVLDVNSGREFALIIRRSGDEAYSIIYSEGASEFVTTSVTDSRGYFLGSRISSTDHVYYKNGSSIGSATATHIGILPARPIYIGAFNNNGGVGNFGNKECAFATIGAGISNVIALKMYNDIQEFQRRLNREV